MIHKSILLLTYLVFLTNLVAQTECFESSETIWSSYWNSCQSTPNPNGVRGSSHWILYDFGSTRNLGLTHIWNVNEAASLDRGFKDVSVDYSTDGSTWQTLGNFQWSKGTGNADYRGFTGPDFQRKDAQYVLVTALSNWGNSSCFGISEMQFILSDASAEDEPNTDIPPTLYSLSINLQGGSYGEVALNPNRLLFVKGSIVTITAQAYQSSIFEGWSGDVLAATEEIHVVMDSHKALVATFSANDSNECDGEELNLSNVLQDPSYRAKISIRSTGEVIVGDVMFQAGQTIELMPGFSTAQGLQFEATIGECDE